MLLSVRHRNRCEISAMKQASLSRNLCVKKTCKREFLSEMEQVVPWVALVRRITPYYPEGKNGRPPFSLETMLLVHFMQQWFTLSDLAMEEPFFETPLTLQKATACCTGKKLWPMSATQGSRRMRPNSSLCLRCRTCGWCAAN